MMTTIRKPQFFSLLSQPCITLLEQTAPQWRSALLRQFEAEAKEAWAVVDACGLETLGDLDRLSPLTLLALAGWNEAALAEPAAFWSSLLQQGAVSIRPLVRPALLSLVGEASTRGQMASDPVDRALAALPTAAETEAAPSSQIVGSLDLLLENLRQRYRDVRQRISVTKGMVSQRDFEVLLQRAGVYDGQPKTLVAIGAAAHLTQQRILQVLERVEERLRAAVMCRFTEALGRIARWAVLAEGGATTVTQAARRIATHWEFGGLHAEMMTLLLARLAGDIAIVDETVLLATPLTPVLMREVAAASIRVLNRSPFSVPFERVVDEVLAAGGDRLAALGRDAIEVMVPLVKQVVIESGECWLRRRSKVAMRIVRLLRESGEAAHFTEITRRYNACFPDEKQHSPHQVHALLQCHPELFVRVGLGLYRVIEHQDEQGLKLANLLEQILRTSERPLHYSEIVTLLKDRYRWTAATIRTNVQDHPRLQRLGNGFYSAPGYDAADFDPVAAYGRLFGIERARPESLVAARFINESAHLVVQVRLTTQLLAHNKLGMQARPLCEMFPTVGKLTVEVLAVGQPAHTLTIRRGMRNMSGLKKWLSQMHAAPGDILFIERLVEPPEMAAPAYRFVYAPTGKVDEALRAVGLSPTQLVSAPRSGR
jgi:hypothetical protein